MDRKSSPQKEIVGFGAETREVERTIWPENLHVAFMGASDTELDEKMRENDLYDAIFDVKLDDDEEEEEKKKERRPLDEEVAIDEA